MNRIIRKTKLTSKEAQEYDRVRRLIAREFPKVQRSMFFITATCRPREDSRGVPDKKCFGFLPTFELAESVIQIHGAGLVECRWSHLVIEEYKCGLEHIPAERAWYEYVYSGYTTPHRPNWKRCGRPSYLKAFICFAMP